MTNREKLAQMSNQELAEELCNVNLDCVGCLGYEWCVTDDGHANGLIKYLEAEAEEDDA